MRNTLSWELRPRKSVTEDGRRKLPQEPYGGTNKKEVARAISFFELGGRNPLHPERAEAVITASSSLDGVKGVTLAR